VDIAVELVDKVVVSTKELSGSWRREYSWASKTVHWLLPWRVSAFDKIVRDHLGVPKGWEDPKRVYGEVARRIFTVAQEEPPEPAWAGLLDLLEELQSDRVERNLVSRRYNQRGFTTRDPEDGGEQERALAERYRDQATALADTWPQAAAVLRALASMYDTDARREDNWAERFRQGQG
jgi:hypothetical protein